MNKSMAQRVVSNNWLRDTLQMVVEMGYRVTPVYASGATKPFAKGQTYKDLSDYKDAVHIGVVLDNAVLLDYDGNKDGPIMELGELAIKLGIDSLPSPAQENKAGDSLHYLFKRPAGVDASTIKASADAYFPNIDIKTGNQLMHLKPHKILNDGALPSLTELPEAPLALMTALRSNPVVEGQLAGARWSGSPEELAEARHILEFIDANCGYDDWMKVLMGIHSKFGDTQEAFNLADDWSKTGSRKYSGGVDVADKLRSFTQSNGNSVNWASVCHTAAEAGANLSNISVAFKVPSSGALLFDFDTPAANLKTGQEAPVKKDTHILAPKNLPTDILSSPVKARPRLYGNTVMRGKVTVLGGAGGVGKSMAQLMITVSLAIGRDLYGRAGKYALQQRRVLLINNEDDAEELELRFRAIIKQCQLSAAEVDLMRSNIHYQSGYHQQLKLAYTGPDKIVRATQLKQEIINYCLQQKIDALMVDPLVSLHDVSENDNGMMNAVMSEIKAVASYAGVGVMLLHHTKKLSGEKIDTDESLRGASSVKDAARVIYLLSRMTSKEATDCGITSEERPRYIRLDDGKANYALPSGVANWYYLHSVGFDAVDEDGHSVSEYVGVPEPVKVNKVTADSDPAVEEKKKDATIKTITKALDDKTWPVKTSDYSALIKKVIGKGNRAALDAIQLFPLIEKGATDDEIKLESELIFLEQGRFRVWRQKGANQATFLHRKTAEGEW